MNPPEQKKKRRAIWSQTLILLAGNGFGAVLSFLITSFLAQVLSVSSFGVYNGVLAWMLPLVVMIECGFATLAIRDLSEHPERSRWLLWKIVPLRLLLSLLLYAVIVVISKSMSDREYAETTLVAGMLVFALPMFNLMSAVLRAHHEVGLVAALNVGMLVLQVFWLLNHSLFTAADTMQINVITSLGQAIFAARLVSQITRDNQEPYHLQYRQWIRDALPFAVAGLLGAIQLRLGLVLLTLESSKLSVGLFAAAIRFIDLARIPLMAYFDAMFPTISALRNASDSLKKLTKSLIVWTNVYGISAGMALVVSAPLLMLLLGKNYGEATDVLRVLALTFPMVALRGALNVYCYATGLEGLANRVSFVALVLALAISLTQSMNATTMAGILFFVEAFSVLALITALAFKHCVSTKFPYTPSQ